MFKVGLHNTDKYTTIHWNLHYNMCHCFNVIRFLFLHPTKAGVEGLYGTSDCSGHCSNNNYLQYTVQHYFKSITLEID